MRWQDLDTAFPEVGWEPGGGWTQIRAQLPIAATHLARAALGLATQPVPAGAIVETIASAVVYRRMFTAEGTDDAWRGMMALMAALEGNWDLVASCTGGAMLGARVVKRKTFGDDCKGLARHLATAARARLPARDVVAAMTEVHARFAAGTTSPDARFAVLAARLFLRDVVVAAEPVAATRSWLAGEPLELEAGRAVRAVADGEDPRVKIFERFAAELADDAALDARLAKATAARPEPWARHLETAHLALDDLAIAAFVARRDAFAGWEHAVDPIVASWLGAGEGPAVDQRFRDLALTVGRSMKLDRGWDDAVKALVVGQPETVRHLTGYGGWPAFRPRQFFKDDGRKLLRYFAAGLEARARAVDLEPAWLDFLARRSPATTPLIERGQLRWKQLLAIQSVLTHQLGGRPRGETGRALQQLVTGV
jgi:hypothetical protein